MIKGLPLDKTSWTAWL